jgi:membrane protein
MTTADAEPDDRLPGVLGRVQRLGTRRGLGWLDTAARVQARFTLDNGRYLAGAISLAVLIALFPLMLLALSIAGFINHGYTDVPETVIRHLGLSGAAARQLTNALHAADRRRQAAGLIGLAGLIWSGFGLIRALQYSYNEVWHVRVHGAKDRLAGIGWLVGAGALFVASSLATALVAVLPAWLSPLALIVATATNVALFLWSDKVLPRREIRWRALLPGALLGGIGLELLKFFGGFYLPTLVKHSSQLYGSIGVVFALIAWLLLFGYLVVYAATLNAVLNERRQVARPAAMRHPAPGPERLASS